MKTHYDLIFAGGGFAGVGAAVSAALAVKKQLNDVRKVDIREVHSIMDLCNALY